MEAGSETFKDNVGAALADAALQLGVARTTGNAVRKRAEAMAAFPQFPEARDLGRRIKDHVVDNLDHYLVEFERNAVAAGARVHWAGTSDEASRIVIDLCRAAGARSVTRSKSMLGEEIGLPHALAEAGIERVETDLAEHIIQLAGERPSHIIFPAMHRTREQVSALFKAKHRHPHEEEDVAAMVASARRELREQVPRRRRRHRRRQLPDRRLRRDLHGHQRGQRRADHHPAAGPDRHRRHREAGALAGPRLRAAAPAGALRDRRRHHAVHHVPLRAEAPRRRRRARRSSTSCWSTTAAPACWRRA